MPAIRNPSPPWRSAAADGQLIRKQVIALKLARDQVRLAETENKAKKNLVSHKNRDFNVTRA
jgi:hypothetical protein